GLIDAVGRRVRQRWRCQPDLGRGRWVSNLSYGRQLILARREEHCMDQALFEAARGGDLETAERLLESGADVNQGDEQGWTPLNFASGRGNLAMVKLLIEKGADPFKTGRDNRTPYMIALAAGRVDVVKYLREVEDATDPEKAKSFRPERKYCKAYHLRDLRQYSGWSESRINWKET